MDKQEIQRKAQELQAVLIKYRSDLSVLEQELLKAIADYHAALKEEKLKEIKASMLQAR